MAACQLWMPYSQLEGNPGVSHHPVFSTSLSHTLPPSGVPTSYTPPEISQGKRKFPDEFGVANSRSRPRLDGPQSQHNPWALQSDYHHRESGDPQPLRNWAQHQCKNETSSPDPIALQRLSNVRTPVDRDAHEQKQHQHGFDAQHVPGPEPGIGVGQMPGNPVVLPQHPQHQDGPKISLDLDALSAGREIDGLPFSGYDFLGDDVFALLGSVFRPQDEQLPPHYEENGQMLWQVYDQAGFHLGPG